MSLRKDPKADNEKDDPYSPPDWAVGRTMYDHLKVITWCLAELRWRYDNHGHDCNGGGYGTSWGPKIPHWL